MALTVTSKGTINDGTNANSYAFGAFTPTANALLQVVVGVTGTNPLPTISDDGGVTWTLRQNNDTASLSIRMWTGVVPASPVSTTITISFTGATGGIGEVVEVPGGTFGQSATGAGAGAATPAVTMAAAIQTTSAVIASVVNLTNPAGITEPTSYTESQDIGHAAPNTGLESAFRNSGETATTITWGGTSASNWRAEVAEIVELAVNENGAATDTVTAGNTTSATVTETGAAVDTQDATIGGVTHEVTVSETGSATDTQTAGVTMPVTLTETGDAADTVTAGVTMPAEVSETGTAADTVTAPTTHDVAITETGAANDNVDATLTLEGDAAATFKFIRRGGRRIRARRAA